MKLSSIVQGSLLLVIGSCAAFSPSSPVASRSVARTVSNNVAALRSGSNPLEVVDDESNAFEAYSVTDPNQGLATKDTVVGTGEAAKTGDVITVAYAGRLMSNGKQFDAGAGFSFKLGEGRVMPGWEQGISVRMTMNDHGDIHVDGYSYVHSINRDAQHTTHVVQLKAST